MAKLLYTEVLSKPKETAKLLIPALLYTVQNNLLFIALTNLDAATYQVCPPICPLLLVFDWVLIIFVVIVVQVTYQLKILTTAIFSVLMLYKWVRLNEWFSLLGLMVGITFVQWPETQTTGKPSDHINQSLAPDEPTGNRLVGVLAVLASCFSSGFSGVYFEKLVKYTSQSLWIRNTQMALFSVITASIAMYLQDSDLISMNGFFQVREREWVSEREREREREWETERESFPFVLLTIDLQIDS